MIKKESAPSGAPLSPWGREVNLDEVDFARVFVMMIERRKTQNLVVIAPHDTETWTLSFNEGELKGLRSRYADEALLTELIAHSALSAEQVERSQRRPAQEDLIEWLLERELVTLKGLRAAQQAVATRHLNQLFALTDGRASFEPYERPVDALALPLSTLRLAVYGVFRGYDRLRLYERFGTLKATPVSRDNGLFRAGLSELERALLTEASGQRSVGQLAGDLGADPLFALSFYYVFSLLSEVHLEVKSPLGDLYERAISSDYFTLLGVGYEASAEEVAEAWRRLRAQVAELGAERSEEGREVIEALKDAHLVLTHPHLRARYLQGWQRPLEAQGQFNSSQPFTTPMRPLALGPATVGAQPYNPTSQHTLSQHTLSQHTQP